MELCKKPELAAEVAMGPIEDFDFDVAILFSDLLFPLEALGMGLRYDPGPKFDAELKESDLSGLRTTDEAVKDLQFQKEAMILTRQKLPTDKSLIGFVGGPWTLFSYAASGGHDGNLILPKTNLSFYKKFCEVLLPVLKRNIQLQLEGGAELVMIFDTAAGELAPQIYNDHIAPHLGLLAREFPGRLGYYSKTTQASHLDNKIFSDSNWAGFGVDHRWDLPAVLHKKTRQQFIQGNFDQALLFLPEQEFEIALRAYLQPFAQMSLAQRAGWVCGLGHGVLPKTPEANVRRFVQLAREILGK
jgi:uroporphyrinogen decarboxylase